MESNVIEARFMDVILAVNLLYTSIKSMEEYKAKFRLRSYT